eukprot:CAMPEP_0184984946 /NCGR_PEP_ID=MMETSP1098-20130426/13801_1 /TAXON_ID=89044 /ORGANISM="Spumella elongata, Strain CCAP 955/1" /LENGTH=53 /DNA_ID=CAMNT_0027508993 /DNA_START=121 /DNA_END=278 /DNA_ORIENTATION=-
MGSENPAMWPDAFQMAGEAMIELSNPTTSSLLCTMSLHHSFFKLFFSSTPSGP